MLVWSWCKFGATLYVSVLTIFTIIKRSESASLLVSERVQIAPRAFCEKQNKVRNTTSQEVKLARSIILILLNTKNAQLRLGIFYYLLDELGCNELPCGHELPAPWIAPVVHELPAALMKLGNSIHEIKDFKSWSRKASIHDSLPSIHFFLMSYLH